MKLSISILTFYSFYFMLFFAAFQVRAESNEPATEPQEFTIAPKAISGVNKPDFLAKVNGEKITEEQVQQVLDNRLGSKGAKIPEQMLDRYKKQVLQHMVMEMLIADAVEDHNIVVSEQEIQQEIKNIASQQNMTVDEFKQVLQKHGMTLEKWKDMQKMELRLGYQKLIEKKFADDVNVTEEDARKFYEENKARYRKPEQVKASHILIKPDDSDPNVESKEAKKEAREKAGSLLKQIKEEGADFATIAKAHSQCPSSAKGGDLGFGNKSNPKADIKGSWVPPFEKAAFDLEVGQVSDVVETQFGYHIIKVTDHKDPNTTSFEKAKPQIMEMLEMQGKGELSTKYIESLMEKADIEYAPGYEPQPRTQSSQAGRPADRNRSGTAGKDDEK